MNTQNTFGLYSNTAAQAAHNTDTTLRLIASLSAPEGLEQRVITGIHSAPRSGRVLGWPRLFHPTENWLRSAAAAAIVFVVIGGGWGVYSRVQPISAVATPPPAGAGGAFSNAGAVRVPQTLPAPAVAQPSPLQPAVAEPEKKLRTKSASGTHRDKKHAAANKLSVQPSATLAR